MRSFMQFGAALLALAPKSVVGIALPDPFQGQSSGLVERQTTSISATCANTPTTRNQWCGGFTVDTDFDKSFPTTGQIVKYDLTITNTTCNPDGNGPRIACMLINNQYPGPTIRARWGDTVQVTVHNNLKDNGTSIHWHGIRQYNSCTSDGVNGVTECPIAPGKSRVYTWKASQFGTSWYHSHHSAQYGDGIVGPIVIEGPSTANYDEDLGPLTLTDWFYTPAWTLNYNAVHTGGPPQAENILVNGSHVNAQNTNGKYTKITVTKGKTYMIRLINTAVDHFFHVSMDGHPFTVVAADFVPTEPKTGVTDLKIAIGQRYNIIFTANQAVGNYWLRVRPGCAVGGQALIYTKNVPAVGAIVSYVGASSSNPTSQAYANDGTCDDEKVQTHWPSSVPQDAFSMNVKTMDVTFNPGPVSTQYGNVVQWLVDGSTFDARWEAPVLEYLVNKTAIDQTHQNIHTMTGPADNFYFWIIQNSNASNPPLHHPIHLHGHDFWLLGTGTQAFNAGPVVLNFTQPVRRDVAMLPAGGWMVLAFPANNPGAWVMHCHIAWHASQGLSVQFLERQSEIIAAQPSGATTILQQGCQEWRQWWGSTAHYKNYVDYDSGI